MSAGPPVKGPERPEDHTGVRRSPSGRIPQWALDEALGRPPLEDRPWRDHTPASQSWRAPSRRARRRRGFSRAALLTITLGVLIVAAWFYSGQALIPQANDAGASDPSFAVSGVEDTDPARGSFTVNPPTPGREAADAPLGTPEPLAERSGAYRFMNVPETGQDFIAYDPCRPVHYVVNRDRMPDGGQQMIADAIANVSAATGLQFVYDGETTEDPSERRQLVQDERYGDRWVPILISWVTPQQESDLEGETIGLGGSSFISMSGSPAVYVSGAMMLDAPQIASLLKSRGGHEQARAIIQHELGHIVGLAHIEDRTQLMYAESNLEVTEFGAGDLTGLAQLGRGVCVPEL